MMRILSVVGTSRSGKTTVIEFIVSHLSKEGLSVGTIKHVHHSGFSFDTHGKDTWRHSRAGAKIVVGVAPDETVTIRKGPLQHGLEAVLDLVRGEKLDLLIIEGFHSFIAKRRDIYKIVTAKDEEDLRRTLEGTVDPILAISGPIAEKKTILLEVPIPLVALGSNGEEILRLVKTVLASA